MNTNKKIMVTAALPYANGPIHIGHLAGCYLPSDIYVRYMRMRGRDVKFVCGSDEHGVPITIKAKKEGITPQEVVDRYHAMMSDAFEEFGISFDHYSRTSSDQHHKNAKEFFMNLFEKGALEAKETQQYFDPEAGQFLADRYITGTCPKCSYDEAYGDQCEKCGTSLSPTELITPKSALSGAKPELRSTTNWFLPLDKLSDDLRTFLKTRENWKPNVIGQCMSWLNAGDGLQPRAMTRDLNWGVPVPIEGAEGKVMYVWFDAPIGYISATQELLPNDWEKYWKGDDAEIVHFIGKDNIVFHCIIFPAMLQEHGDYALPKQVPANEFLNLEGRKLSTSKNWAVWLHEYLQDFPGQKDVLRYVLTATMPETKDNDFTWADFQQRNNSELVAGFGNFVNRVMVLTHKYYDGVVQEPGTLTDEDREVLLNMAQYGRRIAKNLEDFKFREAISEAMSIARLGNKYLQEQEPWKVYKQDPVRAGTVLYVATQITAVLSIVFEPFLPGTAAKLRSMLAMDTLPEWKAIKNETIIDAGIKLGKAELLFAKIEDSQVEAQRTKLEATLVQKEEEMEENSHAAQKKDISFDQFMEMDLRVGTILEAERLPKADRLLKFLVDTGLDKRTIVSGIAEHFTPEEMVGKEVTVLMNLPPRKIRGVESQGMLLIAEDADGKLSLMSPKSGTPSGSVIR
ncbi:MAG TPA: methionine--tRNA ligase [Cryomorphaceae bacterium]|nr:methionine--tRNA ligase [Cryomorphaceae bacterium]|tara:strand:- start:10662 stop:12710 length:2049 start_codon:yes stop_codon:yes gene_type:complete